MTPEEIIAELQKILDDANRIYKAERGDYNAGRIDGVKQCIERINIVARQS